MRTNKKLIVLLSLVLLVGGAFVADAIVRQGHNDFRGFSTWFDNSEIRLGDGLDLKMKSTGANAFIGTATDNTVLSLGDDGTVYPKNLDIVMYGSGSTKKITLDSSADSFTFTGITLVTDSAITPNGGVNLADSKYLNVGTNNDLRLVSDGTNGWLGTATANTILYAGRLPSTAVAGIDLNISGSTSSNTIVFDASANSLTFTGVSAVMNAGVTLGDAAGDAITVGGTVTASAPVVMNGNVTIGNAATDTVTLGGSLDGLRFQQSWVSLDDASASTNWTVSDTSNWTVDVGTGNSRSGGNCLEIASDNTDNDELILNLGVVTDLSAYDYVGFWMRNDGGTVAATELDIDLRTAADTVMTNCGAVQIPAQGQDDWTFVEVPISTCSDRDRFQKFVILADTGITANTAWDIQSVIAYKYSNGNGPVNGEMVYYPVASGTVTQGEVACFTEVGANPTRNGVITCGAQGTAPAGIAVTTSTTNVLLQTTGVVILPVGTGGDGVADNAAVQVLSGGVTVEDSGGVQDSIGYAREAGADAGDNIEIRLMLH